MKVLLLPVRRPRWRRDAIIGWVGAILFGIVFWTALIWAIIWWVHGGAS
jgi:hypothetical protein